ncbi:hypothetical protein EV379_3128 [Microterricola gilva]|uniref:Helix-turn-helix protein n=2 Tax=Microterricola gilva TaxID=393267 RepID=A0A4Q8APY0_9MICO|nr:hypothetical protein EV379_3128 [Microterricola gilva]
MRALVSDNSGRLLRDKLWFDGGFSIIPNSWARDARIGNAARGLLVQLASHEPGFVITIDALTRASKNGRDAIHSQVTELERTGYLKRYRTRSRGQFAGINWRLTDPHAPVDNPGTTLEGFEELLPAAKTKALITPAGENPALVYPSPGNPSAENPMTIENKLKNTSRDSHADVTTEAPVDNSPSSARVQGKIEPQSGTPSEEVFDLASSLRSATEAAPAVPWCPNRRGHQLHDYDANSMRCQHCGERPPLFEAGPIPVFDTALGEWINPETGTIINPLAGELA